MIAFTITAIIAIAIACNIVGFFWNLVAEDIQESGGLWNYFKNIFTEPM